MTRTYSMGWIENKSAYRTYSQLVIEDGDGCPAFVADIWYDSEFDLFFVDIEPALNPNGEANPLNDAVGEANSLDEACAIVEKWFVDTWGLEKAHRIYYEQQSIDWAEDNQDSVRVGANWWKFDDDGNLVFRLAVPAGDASAVVNAGMVYTVDDTWVGVSAPPHRVPRIELFASIDEAKAFIEKDVLERV